MSPCRLLPVLPVACNLLKSLDIAGCLVSCLPVPSVVRNPLKTLGVPVLAGPLLRNPARARSLFRERPTLWRACSPSEALFLHLLASRSPHEEGWGIVAGPWFRRDPLSFAGDGIEQGQEHVIYRATELARRDVIRNDQTAFPMQFDRFTSIRAQ
jgi:hypothetical protein